MRRVFARIVVTVCVAGAAVQAQQIFTSTTALLTLDVSVLDNDGNPVTDLGPDDFVVTLNNETQPVRTMVFLATQRRNTTETVRVPASEAAPSPSSPPATPAANLEPDPKLLVILIDDMSIAPTDSKGLFVAAERFLGTIPVRDSVGLATTSGRVTVNPSLDRAPVMKALKQAFGWMNDPRRETTPFVGFMDALEADSNNGALRELIRTTCGTDNSRNLAQLLAENRCASDVQRRARTNATFARINARNQLDNYAAVIGAMAPAPGVKQLVILTGGVSVKPSESRDFIPIARAAVSAGVQITMLMEDPDPDMSMEAPGAWVKDQQRLLQQAQALAEVSGGQFFRVVGQADRFYQRVLTSASAIYRLGVDLPKGAQKDGNYKVAVTVKRPGVRVFASRHAAPPK